MTKTDTITRHVASHEVRLVRFDHNTFQVWEGDRYWGDVYTTIRARKWTWRSHNGHEHHGRYPNRGEALFDMITTQAAYPHLYVRVDTDSENDPWAAVG